MDRLEGLSGTGMQLSESLVRHFSIPVAAHGVLAIQASSVNLIARGGHEKAWRRACLGSLSGCNGNARGATRRRCTRGSVQDTNRMYRALQDVFYYCNGVREMSSKVLFNLGSVVAVLAFFTLGVESFFSIKGGVFFVGVSVFFLLGTFWEYRQLTDDRKRRMRWVLRWGFRISLVFGGFYAYKDSRELIALSLGLPADDFPSTLSAVFGFHYLVYSPLLLFGILSLLGTLASIPLVLYSYVPIFLKSRERDFSPFIGGYATVIILFTVTSLASLNVGELFTWREGVVEEMAYDFDYGYHENVPCVESGKKSVIHPSGFVSYASTNEDGAITITTEPLSFSCEI